MNNQYKAIVLSLISACFAVQAASVSAPAWGYGTPTGSGPAEWGKLSPSYGLCSTGKKQSPININDASPKSSRLLKIHYSAAPLLIMDDGVTELTIGKQQFSVNLGHSIELDFPGDKETVNYAGETYDLLQMHFHTPGENQLKGHAFPAELHIVHQGPQGKLLVLGVLIKSGKYNPALQQVLNNIPKETGKVIHVKSANINPAAFLPQKHDYYSFTGSLTTPPCAEGVQWLVMATPIEASATQLKQLHAAIGESNSRPLQQRHEREILYYSNH